jgi:two-component system sensor histidine kinase/response regulator
MSDPATVPQAAMEDAAPRAGPLAESRLLRMTRQAVIVTDLQGRVRLWNEAAEALYGWSADEVMGRPITEVTPSAASAAEAAEIMETLRAGASWSGVFEVARRDGSTFLAQVIDSPIYDEHGELSGIVGLSSDVSGHAVARERLRRSDQDLEDFFENASVGLHWVGADGRVLRVNRTELEMLGYSEEEYVGRHVSDFYADPEAIADILARLGRGETLVDYEARLLRKDGSIADVLISSNALFRDGEFVHTRCFTRDVSERKRAEEQLRELKEAAEAANRAKSDFLAVMSHELRTPLNAILGYGALVADEVVGPLNPTQKHHLERMIASARFLLELVDQVLSLSRLEAGREEVRPRPVDVRALAADLASLMRPLAEAKELDLALTVEPEAPAQAVTDELKLRQILLNLLSNAVKFTDAGGVEMRLGARDGDAVFQVRDTGPGIASQHAEAIFEPFEQVDPSRTRREGGAGLGLTVSRRLAKLLGGELTLESEPGHGSLFTVRIPASLPVSETSAPG